MTWVHDWIPRGKFTVCRICGVVRRADDKNKPCKGPVKIGLRSARERGGGNV